MKKIQNKKKTRVMLFGTFDGLHPGHLNFFKQARDLSPDSFLIISIARDSNVLKIKNRLPNLNEKSRLSLIKKTKLADKVVLGGVKNHLSHIKKEAPDIIALGYDQVAYVNHLKEDLKSLGLKVEVKRLKPYKEHIFKNKLLRRI